MRIAIIGGGGHASDVLGVIESLGLQAEIGLLADTELDLGRFERRGVTQWGLISDLPRLAFTHYVMGIGYPKPRRDVQRRVAAATRPEPLTLVHPSAWVHPTARIGAGTVVLGGAMISALAAIGEHCVVHHNSAIGHDARLDDFATVLPGASISGDVTLGEASLVGSRAVVIEKLNVGDEATVGAGAVVSRDVPPKITVKGVPAR